MAWEEFPHSLGQKQTWSIEGSISAFPSTADIDQGDANVSFVPPASSRPIAAPVCRRAASSRPCRDPGSALVAVKRCDLAVYAVLWLPFSLLSTGMPLLHSQCG